MAFGDVVTPPSPGCAFRDEPVLVVSICRRPALRFRSAFSWYNLSAALGGTSLAAFADAFSPAARGDRDGNSTFAPGAAAAVRLTPQNVGAARTLRYRTGLDATSTELVGQDGFGALSGAADPHQPLTPGAAAALFVDKVVVPVLRCRRLLLLSDRFDESLLVLRLALLQQHDNQHQHQQQHGRRRRRLAVVDLAYAPPKVAPPDRLETLSDAQLARLDALQPFDSQLARVAGLVLDLFRAHYPGGRRRWAADLAALRRANDFVAATCTSPAPPSAGGGSTKGGAGAGGTPFLSDLAEDRPLLRTLVFKSGYTARSPEVRAYCDSVMRDNREAVAYLT
jgi:hypothetical protein